MSEQRRGGVGCLGIIFLLWVAVTFSPIAAFIVWLIFFDN
jgi:hypothetical protein